MSAWPLFWGAASASPPIIKTVIQERMFVCLLGQEYGSAVRAIPEACESCVRSGIKAVPLSANTEKTARGGGLGFEFPPQVDHVGIDRALGDKDTRAPRLLD